MMINKRLIGTVSESKKYIAGNVACQWVSLVANIVMIFSISGFLAKLWKQNWDGSDVFKTAAVMAAAILIRYVCLAGASRMSFLSSKTVKKRLREKIYSKLLQMGASYSERVSTSEVIQLCVEGVEQLETYFGAYLPQFFYSMLAPLTLFAVLAFVNMASALVLLICVPLIPVAIAAVQTFAKKLLSRYWGQYTALGDTFLENLQGLTTLKIYQADAFKNEEMNQEAEKFRKITMKVLTMQLNSITVMDLIAYGGAALGVIMAVGQYQDQAVDWPGALAIILLSADFFIPMRQLGSFFHIAMNGMAASDKIFRLLDLSEDGRRREEVFPEKGDIICEDVDFAYEEGRKVLRHIHMTFKRGSLTAIVGESGCGKSTVAGLLTGRNRHYTGSICVGNVSLPDIRESSLMENVTYVSFNSYLFKGTVGENLRLAAPEADDDRLWEVLEQTRLADFLRSQQGLATMLSEKGSNLSGGQCQRLALARAILHDSPVYIFDEATSNIDVESENVIMEQILELARTKTVILISHRLANVVSADQIYVMEAGRVKESGRHGQLIQKSGVYQALWQTQQSLENYGMAQVGTPKKYGEPDVCHGKGGVPA